MLTGYENLKLHGMLYGMSPPLREQRIGEVLDLVDLTNRKDSVDKQYSGACGGGWSWREGACTAPKCSFPTSRRWDSIRSRASSVAFQRMKV